MRIVNIRAAKTHLSRLVDEAAAGEGIVIAKAGEPLARLVPFVSGREPRSRRLPRTPGLMKSEIWISENFRAFARSDNGSRRATVICLSDARHDGAGPVHA